MGVDSINAGGETPVTLKKEEQTPARIFRAGVPIFPRIYLLFVFILCNPLILCLHQKNSLSSLVDCDIIIRHLGADGCWCALWSSKPVIVVSSCIGGFNSHTFPPKAHSCWNELFPFLRKKEEPNGSSFFIIIRLVRRMVQTHLGTKLPPQSVHSP